MQIVAATKNGKRFIQFTEPLMVGRAKRVMKSAVNNSQKLSQHCILSFYGLHLDKTKYLHFSQIQNGDYYATFVRREV